MGIFDKVKKMTDVVNVDAALDKVKKANDAVNVDAALDKVKKANDAALDKVKKANDAALDKVKKATDLVNFDTALDKVKFITEIKSDFFDPNIANINLVYDKVKSVGEIKSAIIGYVFSIDYSFILDHLNNNKNNYPMSDLIISTVETFIEAGEIYKTSESICKDRDFIIYMVTNIDPEKVINELEPIVSLVPWGGVILLVLKLLIKLNKALLK